jgi:kinesin family protein 1
MSDTSIRVAVRCRPLNSREIARGATPLISINGNSLTISPDPTDKRSTEKEAKAFSFDRAFDSQDKSDPNYASQQVVFDYLGKDLLAHAFDGFNTALFAYGQTGRRFLRCSRKD